MPKLTELVTEITVNASKFKKGLDEVKSKMNAVGIDAKRVAAVTAGIFTAAGIASVKFINMAADARESMSKFRTVFREQSDEVLQWSDNFAEATGRSKFALRGFLASVQDLFVPLGFARDDAADLSKQVVTLATDLSSFSNIPVGDVMRDVQSALIGNTETVRKYGVMLDAANTTQKAFEMTGKKNTKQLTNTEKVMARLELIMNSTTDAQGDAIRTSNSLANQMVRLQSNMEEVGVSLGEALVPAALEFLEVIKELTPTIKAFFGESGAGTKFIREVSDGLMAALEIARSVKSAIPGVPTGDVEGSTSEPFIREGLRSLLPYGAGNLARSLDVLPNLFSSGAAAPAVRTDNVQQEMVRELRAINNNTAEFTAIGT